MRRTHAFSRRTVESTRLLGQRIRLGRRERRMTVGDLAERVGVAEGTIRRLEQGDPNVALGIAFEAAVITGVALFDKDDGRRHIEAERVADRLAVLPASVRRSASNHAF